MATRNRAQRGDDLREFVGRVRKWRKEWKPAGTGPKSKKLIFQRWIATDERDLAALGNRHPDIVPLPTPTGKPPPPMFMRPLWQQRAAGAPSMGGAAQQQAPKVTVKLKINSGGAARQPSVAAPGQAGAQLGEPPR